MGNDTTSKRRLAAVLESAPAALAECLKLPLAEIVRVVLGFRAAAITPQATFEFERTLQGLLRELGLRLVAWTFNHMEVEQPEALPDAIEVLGERYRRRCRSPRRGTIATLFGSIELTRWLYRSNTPGEAAIFPLEINLGIEAGGATPALAERAGWLTAASTQTATVDILAADHGVKWSVATLRKLLDALGESLSAQRHPVQVQRLLELLKTAEQSRGSRKIVLAVGRDGVFVPIRKSKAYQEAVAATVSIYDRRGKRLGTVYLGRMPESGQTTLSKQLTDLLADVLRQWTGPPPRLCYVTDSGHHPTEYFRTVLEPMTHPVTGKALVWESSITSTSANTSPNSPKRFSATANRPPYGRAECGVGCATSRAAPSASCTRQRRSRSFAACVAAEPNNSTTPIAISATDSPSSITSTTAAAVCRSARA